MGNHEGIHVFTIGQRKGLPAGAPARRWVKQISADTGEVKVTGRPDELVSTTLVAKDPNWLAGELPTAPLACSVQVCYRHRSEPATVVADGKGGLAVTFHQPVKAVTPGQADVYYDGERTLGRRWIDG